jgi:glycerophosphoryl diester phosphodiesterase
MTNIHNVATIIVTIAMLAFNTQPKTEAPVIDPTTSPATVVSAHEESPVPRKLTQYRFVAHAGGALTLSNGQKVDYTNSLEAILQNYENGYRVFEIDFAFTVDGCLVAVHGWDPGLRLTGLPVIPTREQWENSKILGKYQTLQIDDILNLMSWRKDFVLVTDIKYSDRANIQKAFEQIVERAKSIDSSVLSRIIPQVYDQYTLGAIDNIHAFNEIIYTLYRSSQTPDQIVEYVARENRIAAVTMMGDQALQETDLVKRLNEKHVAVYAHTINSERELASLRDAGVYGVYTDTLKPR